MAASSVIVHDIDSLEKFGSFLVDKHDRIEDIYDSLMTECLNQGANWQDAQYTQLKERLEYFSAASKSQLEELTNAIAYIYALVDRLRNA